MSYDFKLVHDVTHLNYDDRLTYLGLTRLNRRRDRIDLVETLEITNSVYNVQYRARDFF